MTIYEVYSQNPLDNENKKVSRYHTENKTTAFRFMVEKNKIAGANVWRVAIQVSDRIIFDIDNDGIDNVERIVRFYRKLLGDYRIIKSYTGYHIFSEEVSDDLDFSYRTCKVLNPLLEKENLLKYAKAIRKWYEKKLQEEFELRLNRKQWIEGIQRDFPESGLYCGYGDFDILFALNVVLKGYYCLRISKKSDDDKVYEIKL